MRSADTCASLALTGQVSSRLALVSWRLLSSSLHLSASLMRPAACWVSRVGSLKVESDDPIAALE